MPCNEINLWQNVTRHSMLSAQCFGSYPQRCWNEMCRFAKAMLGNCFFSAALCLFILSALVLFSDLILWLACSFCALNSVFEPFVHFVSTHRTRHLIATTFEWSVHSAHSHTEEAKQVKVIAKCVCCILRFGSWHHFPDIFGILIICAGWVINVNRWQ